MNNQFGTFLFKSLPNDLDILKSQYNHSQSNVAISEGINKNKNEQIIQINEKISKKNNNYLFFLISPLIFLIITL